MTQLSASRAGIGAVLVVAGALEALTALLLERWHNGGPGVAAALGVLIAVLAGALAGRWVGLVVAAAGWGFYFAVVAHDSLRALPALPAWLAAGVAAGWIAARLHASSREVDAKYRSLTTNLPVVTYAYPPGERAAALEINPQVEALLGYSAREWLAEPNLFERLLHPEDRERVLAEIAAAGETGAPLHLDYRLLARDGRVVSVHDEAVTVRDGSGRPSYVQGYLLDVSERKRAEEEKEELRAGERAAVVEMRDKQRGLDFLAQVATAFATSLDVNTTLRRLAELAARELADWVVIDVLDEDGDAVRLIAVHTASQTVTGPRPAAEPEREVLAVIRSGEPELLATRISVPLVARTRSLGAITFVSSTPSRTYGTDDLALVEGFATTAALAIDVARLYRQVDERADAARVLTYVADGVFLLDKGGIVRLWNPAAELIMGLQSQAVVTRPAADAIPGWEALADRIPVRRSPEDSAAPTTLPVETVRGERWISISGVEFFGGTVYAFRDLTEDRRLEELKADFLATASHELRTPLAAVYGAAQTLRRHDFALDEAGRDRFISMIVDESERLGRIVNEILLANQLELGRVDLVTGSFDGAELMERVVEAVRIHAPPRIELDVVAPEFVPPVGADRDKVRQILMNLVENGIKYSPDGGRIELGVEPGDGAARFHVFDEGLGVPAEEHARIFDKFYRLDPEMTRGVGGTGLGLYICSELVQRMGGQIWIESREKGGSAFFFEIPYADVAAARVALTARETADA